MNFLDAADTKLLHSLLVGAPALFSMEAGTASTSTWSRPLTTPLCIFSDVYILENSDISGIVQAIRSCRFSRVLLNRFFTAPDIKSTVSALSRSSSVTRTMTKCWSRRWKGCGNSSGHTYHNFLSEMFLEMKSKAKAPSQPDPANVPVPVPVAAKAVTAQSHPPDGQTISDTDVETSIVAKALALEAAEIAMEVSDLDEPG